MWCNINCLLVGWTTFGVSPTRKEVSKMLSARLLVELSSDYASKTTNDLSRIVGSCSTVSG